MVYSSRMLSLFLISTVASLPFPQKVIRCPINSDSAASNLSLLNLDIWSEGVSKGRSVDVLISNKSQEEELMNAIGQVDCSIFISNVDSLLADSSNQRTTDFNVADDSLFFKDYQNYDTVNQKLQSWSSLYPDLVSYTASIGSTVEGRDIPMIKITDKSVTTVKKNVFWNGGQHAREWASPATVMYITKKLLDSSSTPSVKNYLSLFVIHVIPIQNPDGYEYTRRSGGRLWRKNRSKNSDGTFGVDLNRNWDEHWGYVGSSTDKSSDVYRGPKAFSEPETIAVSNYILGFQNRYAAIGFHSYSQLILRNWGWTSKKSKNEGILKEWGDSMAKAIYQNSKVAYTSEPGASLYAASGCADDWYTTKAGMIGYTIELRDTGRRGFLLGSADIVPMGEEIWSAMQVFLEFLVKNPNIPVNEEL